MWVSESCPPGLRLWHSWICLPVDAHTLQGETGCCCFAGCGRQCGLVAPPPPPPPLSLSLSLWSQWWVSLCLLVVVVQSLSHLRLFCNPMDCSPPGSSVHGISQARILEWVALPSSRGSSQPGRGTEVSCIGRQILYHWATGETPPLTNGPHFLWQRQVPPLWEEWGEGEGSRVEEVWVPLWQRAVGTVDPLHRVHGRRLATVSGPGGARRGRGPGAGERRVWESGAETGLGEEEVHSWLPEVGTMQDTKCTRAAAPTCGWASKGGDPAISRLT